MTTRWEVERAVLWSKLKPPARLIMLTLLVKADNETAVIPPEHSPSLTTLQACTGLSRSMLGDYLAELEAAGWVKRSRPAKKGSRERTSYALCVPDTTSPPDEPLTSPPGGLVAEADYSTSPQGEPVRKANQSRPAETEEADFVSDSSSPPGGHASTTSTPSSTSTTSSSGRKPPRSDSSRGTRIPADFWPDASMITWARTETPNVGTTDTHAFIDYWRGKSGKDATKVDWPATWRNWMRKAQRDYNAEQARIKARERRPEAPPSTAPVPLRADEQCPDHRGQRKDSCRYCRAARLGKAG